ncbi:bifunctional 2',3'-cyclic-nucleotide 2'-phosphodiesterase/3'-nucleotidase [Bacillus sp. 03113]|uniref:bifunctional 2',3'-cyclic-nucleotide 2'-phosphodiesterase/3'-nucleotidase n=1 Tax=Bacillus sp. 03113 TaxID=2578211 RepID=UPI0011436C83|nr:bifunctional 2',3'-cyclic-nucleotide 2'-phosphodiesterase/3'-nucleotidase [Bacillus sp. 03113]
MEKEKHHLIRKSFHIFAVLLLLLSLIPSYLIATPAKAEELPVVDLQLLETTDLHANIMDYDYYSDAPTSKFGLARTAQLINQHRNNAKNTILVDNGDLIQGSPLGEYVYKHQQEFDNGASHPIFKALNILNYDAGTLGNHEFNYGLEFLDNSLKAANFPIVNANVFNLDGSYRYAPYKIVDKEVTDNSGIKHTLKVGYTGFVPPQINTWDKKNLDGKVITKDIVESANKVIPEMKKEGADLIIVLAHTGIETQEQGENAENAVFDLALKVPGIDAIVSGHQHDLFPGNKKYEGIANIDVAKGTINGIPVVMPKNWGSHLGVIDLKLQKETDDWKVIDSKSAAEPITTVTAPDPKVAEAIKEAHEKTLQYVRTPVGKTEAPINSFFALVQDDPSIQIVTDAQKWFAEKELADSEYKNLPILSAGAPFKAGGRNGADYYTNIAQGDLAIKNIGDLYLYDNTVYVLKLTGAEVKEWLEMSAGQFNQIDPNKTEEQALVNSDFPTYNFDVIDGVTYQIDVTEPAKYKRDGTAANPEASRIKNLKYEGKDIDPNQEFLVVSNNYRASGGGYFPNIKADKVVFSSTVENRQVLNDYITEQKTINPSADGNWSFAPVFGDVKVTFESSPKAQEFTGDNISYVQTLESGFAKYEMYLPKSGIEEPLWDLTIMHTNDTHAHLDNVARRVTAVDEIRNTTKNNLLLDAGDVFSGDLYYTEWKGLADLEFMKLMRYDAMTLGNHEFDDGPSTLAQFIKDADFPIVSSNLDFSKEPALSSLLKQQTLFMAGEVKDPGIYPYVVMDVNGEKVAVFGLTTEDTVEASSPGENIVFNQATESAKTTVKKITDNEQVDKIVALSHLGYERDLKLAEDVEGIDVIVGGHTHTKVDQPVIINNDDTPTVVVQANEFSNYLGRLDVAFNDQGIVIPEVTTGELITLDKNVPENEEAKALLSDYKNQLDAIKNEVVGKAGVELDGVRNNVRTKETNLGNLIADGMLDKARSTIKGASTSIAIQNGGGIRGPIDKGDITLGEVRTVLPFGNTIYLVDLTGEQIVKALENGVKNVETVAGAFPQVAGMRYSFTKSRPAGERILSVEVKNEDGSYSPIDMNKTYKIVTNAFVGKGGDGYDVLKEGKNGEDLGIADYVVFTQYLDKQKDKTVSPVVEGRITEIFEPSIAIENNSAKVIFDESFNAYVQQANDVVVQLPNTKNLKSIELNLTKEQVQLLKARPNPVLTIKNEKVGLMIPSANLEEANTVIKLVKSEPIKDALTDVYDFSIQQDGKELKNFKDKVTLAFFLDKEAKNPKVYYVDRNGNKFTEVETDYEGSVVYGHVDHFSEYAVFEKMKTGENPNPSNPNQPNNPSNPNQPNGPTNPSNPNQPNSPTNPSNINQPNGSTNSGTTNGHALPNTATNIFNQFIVGILLFVGGLSAYLYYRRKQRLNRFNI